MPQMQLPIFPEGTNLITSSLGFIKNDDQVTYMYGHLPVFTHAVNDVRSFQMIISQFVVNGGAKQTDIIRAFGVTAISVKRAVKRYREHGPSGFYEERNTRGAVVLTESVLKKVQSYLDEGLSAKEISEKMDIKQNTLEKAIRAGRLHQGIKKKNKKKTASQVPRVIAVK